MKLPIPALFGKKSPSNYYLALLLRDEKAVAVVLEELQGKLHIKGIGETTFSTHLEDIPFEELLESLDRAISKAEDTLPPNVETEQTVFGVKDGWVEDKKIKKEYLTKLKKLCDSLSLQPIGFMVIAEAISHLLSEEEGAPLSAILSEIGKHQITLTLFRANRILEVHSARIEDSIPQTVDRLLHHFTTDVLPSRIVVFNGGEGEELAQKFIAHHWSKSIPFLHVPQISVLPEGFDNKAMVYGAAEQMGFTALGALGDISVLNLNESSDKPAKSAAAEKPPVEEEGEDEKETKHAKEDEIKLDEEHEEEEKEKEIDEKDDRDEKGKEDKDDSDTDEIITEGENFGFVMEQDIAAVSPHASHAEKKADKETAHETPHAFRTSEDNHETNFRRSSRLAREDEESDEEEDSGGGFSLAGIFGFLPGLLSGLTALNPFKGGGGMNFSRRMLLIPLILVLLVGLAGFYLFSLKSTVTLHMQAKKIDESTEITLQTDSGNDLSQKILAAKEVETSVDGSVSTDATGKKDVGDKAKGTVTLYNSAESKRTVPAGTVITSSNDLDFVTDKEAVVASASGDIFSGVKSGTAQVSVTAKNIGTEYNLPSNTKFTVSGGSGLAAKNDSAFSGGTKKTVTVVAKKDVDTLTANLPKELQTEAKESIKTKVSSNESILPMFTDVTLSKKSTDRDIGEEAKKVTMKGTVTFSTLSYSSEDLKSLAEASLKGRFSEDLALSDKGIEANLKDIKAGKNNDATATLEMSAGLLPKIDKDSIVKELTGKSFSGAESYLKTLPQVASAEIVLSPNLPFLPKLLPRFSKNITVVLDTND